MSKKIISYSGLKCLMTCPKKYKYSRIMRLIPKDKDFKLFFGSMIGRCLERYYTTPDNSMDEVLREIQKGTISIFKEDAHKGKEVSLNAWAMMKAYVKTWEKADKNLEFLKAEKKFVRNIQNPKTKRFSRKYQILGFCDGYIKYNDVSIVMENKTTSKITDEYIEKLAFDFQSVLYADSFNVDMVLYNILQKKSIRLKKGETEEGYNIRKQELINKSINKTTSAKRKIPESDGSYFERLDYGSNDFERIMIETPLTVKSRMKNNLWSLIGILSECERREKYPMFETGCFQYNTQCDFWPICKTGWNDDFVDENYDIKEEFKTDV